jgi:hypothetical protein
MEWEVWFRDQYWGQVMLVNAAIQVNGPKDYAIRNLLKSLRRGGMDDATLFRSLPERLNGHLFIAFPRAYYESQPT